MIAKHAMTRSATAAIPKATARQIADEVREGHYSRLPIIDGNRSEKRHQPLVERLYGMDEGT